MYNTDAENALRIMAHSGSDDVYRALLALMDPPGWDRTFVYAARWGAEQLVRHMLDEVSSNVRRQHARRLVHVRSSEFLFRPTALIAASMQPYPRIVSMLRASGADRDVCGDNRWNALRHALFGLHAASTCGVRGDLVVEYEKTVTALCMEDGLADQTLYLARYWDNGGTPLTEMASLPMAERPVRLLLRLGADPNEPDRVGNVPLVRAAYSGDAAVVRALLDAGADPYAHDNEGATALSIALARHNECVAEQLRAATTATST